MKVLQLLSLLRFARKDPTIEHPPERVRSGCMRAGDEAGEADPDALVSLPGASGLSAPILNV